MGSGTNDVPCDQLAFGRARRRSGVEIDVLAPQHVGDGLFALHPVPLRGHSLDRDHDEAERQRVEG
jgi:hypothetical protein